MGPTGLAHDLPIPTDDGAAGHLEAAPAIALHAANGALVDFHELAGLVVIYIYLVTGAKPGTGCSYRSKGWVTPARS